ncbi:c-type cytochrome [Methylomagnum sp.]
MPKPIIDRRLALSALAACLIPPNLASAEPPAGRLLASQCGQCHGTNGNAVSGFESLAGKSASEIYHEVMEMHDPKRPVESIMDMQARGYTPEQLWAISQYLATQPRTSSRR